MKGLKVVTAQEMARIEAQGTAHESWMKEAGAQIAQAVIAFVEKKGLAKTATLLVGTGNNGGDAYVAGITLLDRGFQVRALIVSDQASPLNRKFGEQFRKKGGIIASHLEGVILDGLLGTGFKGTLEPKMARLIEQANASGLPIIAIDLPSGLNGTTGEVENIAIRATETVALGLPKIGCFLRDGWNHTGNVRVVDFGLSKEAVAQAAAAAFLAPEIALPKIERNRHKYQAGQVVGFAGSKALPGAVKLAGLAALKAGAGMVRLFGFEEIGELPYELIHSRWSAKGWQEALQKAQSIFIGPGLGRSPKVQNWLKIHLKNMRLPCVIDADGLMPDLPFPSHAILTPHRGEMLRLLNLKEMPSEEELWIHVSRFCAQKQTIVVLKGAPTFVFAPDQKPFIVLRGDPGMATAGSGDVLTGIIAALLAQKCSPLEAAILGASLHGIAGEKGAQEKTSYCLIASDLIDFMPWAFRAKRDNI